MSPLSRRHLLASLAAAGALAATPVRAAPTRAPVARPAPLSPQEQSELLQVQRYLNDIHTLQSRFQQFAQDGGVSSGTIYLQRPGKMRIVYDPPTPVLIVSDGSNVYYWDSQLQQVQHIGVEDTPAWFLLRPEIKLTGDVTITGFVREPGVLRIAMTETNHPTQGSLTLVMSEGPLELRQWTVVDPQQKQVTVMLQDPHYGVTLDPQLFVWIRQGPGPVQ